MMQKVESAYKVFYKLYNDTMVAKLIQESQPKWFRCDKDLKVNDVVYFRKSEGSAIKGDWTVGIVEAIKRGMDGLIREATIKYSNPSEGTHRYTERAIRSLVRLFNVMDGHWRFDMEKVAGMLKDLEVKVSVEKGHNSQVICDHIIITDDPTLCRCCCASHCALSLHVARGVKLVKETEFNLPEVDVMLATSQAHSEYMVDTLHDYLLDETSILGPGDAYSSDSFMGLITALNTDLKLA